MCGRFTLAKETAELTALLPDVDCSAWSGPRYNIAPGQDIPVITHSRPAKLELLKWGLVPFWAKEQAIGSKMINARSESLTLKPTFRKLVNRKRCVILADGFYEWQSQTGGRGQNPFYFKMKDQPLFGFAGLWDSWTIPDGGTLFSCTILTISANDLVKRIHSRMAVMLETTQFAQWLDLSNKVEMDKHPLLQRYPVAKMEMYPVGRKVNKVLLDNPSLIEPFRHSATQLTLTGDDS